MLENLKLGSNSLQGVTLASILTGLAESNSVKTVKEISLNGSEWDTFESCRAHQIEP